MKWMAALCLLLLPACAIFEAMFIGAGTGAVATKTPEGAAVGAAAGFMVGIWHELTSAVTNWWRSMFGGPSNVPPPSPGNPIVLWIVVALVAWGLFKLLGDADFRDHLIGFFKTGLRPKIKRRKRTA